METTGKLIRVTPEELAAILDRCRTENVTILAIIGPGIRLSDDPTDWPEDLLGEHSYQLDKQWDSVAERVARLSQLRHLLLWSLELNELGARAIAEDLPQLNSLSISGNKIGDAGALAIAEHLPQLNSLDVGSNKIGDAGARAIAEHLQHLNSLSIGSNEIGDAGVRAIAEHLTQLNSLSIRSNKIGDAGARAIAEHLTPLNSLDIGFNQIGDAGARAIAEHLQQLSSLNIDYNNIEDAGVRAIAEHLPQLKSLSICGNKIGDAGARAIAEHLQQLNSLYVSRNNIGDAGARAIATNLRHLKSLWLNNNSIGQGTIDAIGQNLHALTKLSVAENDLVSDISPLAQLPAISHLNASETSVSDLSPFAKQVLSGWPVRWDRYAGGNGLFVEECPLVRPTVEIANQGPEAVRNYFREIETQGVDRLYEAKVLILGGGGAGKTSLLRRLYQTDQPLPTEDQTTRGIDIHRQDFTADNGKPFRLNVWDFGGQQIYHATHQFFLTKSSLYILVDDTRKDDKSIHDEAFKFWLEVVETLSDSSPLLIFQNEKGGRSKSIDEPGIKGRFPNFQQKFAGNLDDPDSATKIRQAIEYFVQQLPHVGDEVPAKWIPIRQAVEEVAQQKPFITQEEYFQIYSRHLEFDRTKALHLSRYLHDLGVFLHFQDDPLLRKTVILQNQWATEAVFRILDDELVKQQRGRFSQADCERIWLDSQYADMHAELLGLMVKFELCYPLGGAGEFKSVVGNASRGSDVAYGECRWLAPQLLSPSKPQELDKWAAPSDLVVSFRYTFLPRGLVSRLMVRQHRFAKQLDLSWAHGAFFEHDGTAVLVEETTKGNEIEIRARGPENKALLSVLATELEALNDTFKGLKGKVEKWVPCICPKCRATTDPDMFRQKELVERKGKHKLTIECRKSYEDVSVLELLDGLKLEHLPDWAKAAKPVADPVDDGDRTLPRVLISYSHDSDAHAAQVRKLAERLRGDGVDCRIDQYVTNPSQGWPLWMDAEVEAADFVLILFTERYATRAREPRKSGVRFESVLILNDLYDAGMLNDKFIPILFDQADERHILKWLRPYNVYVVSTEDGHEKLRRRLLDDPSVLIPPLGSPTKKGPANP